MARTISLSCFHCGRRMEFEERVGFRERCPGCDRPVHICLSCEFYDASYNNQCRETQAERVVDKERANFCEYFTASRRATVQRGADARSKLEEFFKKR